MLLVEDIGETSSRVALLEVTDGRLKPAVGQKFLSRECQHLDDILRLFVTLHRQPVNHACFGIAGTLKNGRAKPPILPGRWRQTGSRPPPDRIH